MDILATAAFALATLIGVALLAAGLWAEDQRLQRRVRNMPRLPDLPRLPGLMDVSLPPRGCPDFYAVVLDGERVADVSTNRNRARALAVQQAAQGKRARLVRYRAVKEIETFAAKRTEGSE